jgi:P4 family phage/plasmid primase-like protien
MGYIHYTGLFNSINNASMNINNVKSPKTDILMSYSKYMMQHMAKKSQDVASAGPPREITNTRIGCASSNIPGGSYHIPKEEYTDFIRLYHAEVIEKGTPEYLTEKQLEVSGPILIDFDLKFDYSVIQRLYTRKHVKVLVELYLEILITLYQFTPDVNIPIYVLEKPRVNRVESKNITKDGLHIIIGLMVDHKVQCILRDKVLEKISTLEYWKDLPITNTWPDIIDKGITIGHTNWQLYGSCKPNNDTYTIKYALNAKIDPSDNELEIVLIDNPRQFESIEHIRKLSARYDEHITFPMTHSFSEEYNKSIAQTSTRYKTSPKISKYSTKSTSGVTHEEVLGIVCRQDLDSLLERYLESITSRNINIRDSYDYAMSLPISYYGPGSYDKWLRMGFALRNIDDMLFIVWVAFSAQCSTFDFLSIREELWDRWITFTTDGNTGLTIHSIIHWVKTDAPKKYIEIQNSNIDFQIEETLTSPSIHNYKSASNSRCRSCTDMDIAKVLHSANVDKYVCVRITSGQGVAWYHFNDNRWETDDCGIEIAHQYGKMRILYSDKANHMSDYAFANDNPNIKIDSNDKTNPIVMKIEKCYSIVNMLGGTNIKNNILREAKELFYVKNFASQLDQNPWLMGFDNGIVDFKEGIFRKGRSEDYISMSTRINYVDSDNKMYASIVEEIKVFMHQLFPDESIHNYMWDHLASVLIGVTMNQTFNMYIGDGQNGKSVLMDLMAQCLGDYRGDVPLSLVVTNSRTKIGGVAPELVNLRTVRYAVMQEPSKGDKLNEGIMKQITGGDTIQARGLYAANAISFNPQFTLVVCANILMGINSDDHGTWRRIRVVPFESRFTDNPISTNPDVPYQFKLDKLLKERFPEWKTVFMGMLVKRAFITKGIVADCERVMAATNTYKRTQNHIAEFDYDSIVIDEHGTITKSAMLALYREWNIINYGPGKNNSEKECISYMEKKYGKLSNKLWTGISAIVDETEHHPIGLDASMYDICASDL